jgi:hypothetical protein
MAKYRVTLEIVLEADEAQAAVETIRSFISDEGDIGWEYQVLPDAEVAD